MKKVFIALTVGILLLLSSCSLFSTTTTRYTVDDLTMTVTGNYTEREQVGFRLCFLQVKQ